MNGSVNRESGFTIIELMVVVSIIGALAGLALSHFITYRAHTFDIKARDFVKVLAVAEETYFIDTSGYVDCDTSTCDTILPGVPVPPSGVTVSVTSTASGFIATGTHAKGTGISMVWNSSSGGFAD